MELGSREGKLSHTQSRTPAGRKMMRIILTREGIFHWGILSPVFKNKEDPFLP